MEGVNRTDRARNEEVLHKTKDEKNILHTIKSRKANWIGHSFRRNCRLKHVIEWKVERGTEVMGRQWRRDKQLLDDVKETRGYWKLKAEALDSTYVELALQGVLDIS